MPKSLAVGLGLIFLGVAIAVFNPLVPLGTSFGPGWGDILNGGAALLLLVIGAFVAYVGRARNRSRTS